MRIAVAGGTGTVGRHVVEAARDAGHEVGLLARSQGVDLLTGDGLDAALAEAEAVIDTANISTMNAGKATAFFTAASGNLLAAASRAGVRHAVLLSIVGIEKNPHDYYAGKLAQERLYTEASTAWSILRATQFHEFAAQMFDQARVGPIRLAPRARTQPVAAREVASRLVRLATEPPMMGRVELAGPREEELSDLVKRYARARGYGGPVFSVALPGRQMKGMRAGLNLPSPAAEHGSVTFDDWLREIATEPASVG